MSGNLLTNFMTNCFKKGLCSVVLVCQSPKHNSELQSVERNTILEHRVQYLKMAHNNHLQKKQRPHLKMLEVPFPTSRQF